VRPTRPLGFTRSAALIAGVLIGAKTSKGLIAISTKPGSRKPNPLRATSRLLDADAKQTVTAS
jgi:hypothetical protein